MSLPKPYYQRDQITIYYGDCREILAAMGPGSISLIVSDVAYRNQSGGNGGDNAPSGILATNDGKIFLHNDIETSEYAGLFYRVLADPAHCYIMCGDAHLEAALRDFRLAGFEFHRLLGWRKNTATPNRWYMRDFEPILFFRKGEAFTINNPSSKAIIYCPNIPKADKIHKTEKPEPLMRIMVLNSSKPGQVVCDPFAGSCSALEAVIRAGKGRTGIGIDIDEEYCRAGADRLENLLDHPWQLTWDALETTKEKAAVAGDFS